MRLNCKDSLRHLCDLRCGGLSSLSAEADVSIKDLTQGYSGVEWTGQHTKTHKRTQNHTHKPKCCCLRSNMALQAAIVCCHRLTSGTKDFPSKDLFEEPYAASRANGDILHTA